MERNAVNFPLDMAFACEVISGAAPVERRLQLMDLMVSLAAGPTKPTSKTKGGQITKGKQVPNRIYTESSRDIARDLLVGEALYKMSVALGVQIVPADAPDLFKHSPSSSEKYHRQVTLAKQELDKNRTRERLAKGIDYAFKTTPKRTQEGKKKVNGRNSILENLFAKRKMGATIKHKLGKLFKRKGRGEMGFSCNALTVRRGRSPTKLHRPRKPLLHVGVNINTSLQSFVSGLSRPSEVPPKVIRPHPGFVLEHLRAPGRALWGSCLGAVPDFHLSPPPSSNSAPPKAHSTKGVCKETFPTFREGSEVTETQRVLADLAAIAPPFNKSGLARLETVREGAHQGFGT